MSEHLYRRGAALQRARRDAEALADFQRLVKEFPDSPWRNESVYSIGYIYSQRGEFSRALPYFRKIAEALPDRDIAERSEYAIGICLFNLGSFDRALESFETLRGSRPRSIGETSIVLSIGRTLYRMERLQEAAKRLREAIALSLQGGTKDNAEGAEARYWLGWSLFRLNRYSEARDAFISLAELRPPDPRRPEAFFRAGICETMMNEDEEAIGYFENSLSSSPAGSFPLREQTLYELGWAFSRRGKRDESAAAFERLAREYPGGKLAAEAFFKAAAYALESKRYADALAGYKRVIREFPGSALAAQARYWSAQARLESGDARGAIDAFWLSLEAVGSGSLLPAATEGFRKSLLASGSVEMARAFVEKARASRSLPLEASASIELACAELLLGASPGEAYAIVQEVKRRMPPEPLAGEASLLAGRYYAAISDWSRALDVFSALSRSRADSVGAEAKREEARAMEASGRTAEAIEEYVKISYLFADFTDLAAEGLFNAVRVALKRGERETAIRIAGTLRANYPYSPWAAKLGELR
jgi:TolA-binding protein